MKKKKLQKSKDIRVNISAAPFSLIDDDFVHILPGSTKRNEHSCHQGTQLMQGTIQLHTGTIHKRLWQGSEEL